MCPESNPAPFPVQDDLPDIVGTSPLQAIAPRRKERLAVDKTCFVCGVELGAKWSHEHHSQTACNRSVLRWLRSQPRRIGQ